MVRSDQPRPALNPMASAKSIESVAVRWDRADAGECRCSSRRASAGRSAPRAAVPNVEEAYPALARRAAMATACLAHQPSPARRESAASDLAIADGQAPHPQHPGISMMSDSTDPVAGS